MYSFFLVTRKTLPQPAFVLVYFRANQVFCTLPSLNSGRGWGWGLPLAPADDRNEIGHPFEIRDADRAAIIAAVFSRSLPEMNLVKALHPVGVAAVRSKQ